MRRGLVFAALLALAGCGDLPHPFQNNPGLAAIRLSQPPPSRLAVPTPDRSLLDDTAASTWAQDVADALAAAEVPAVAGRARVDDWRLQLSAELHGRIVLPRYTVLNAAGIAKGTVDGSEIAAESWAAGSAATLQASAAQAAPQLAEMLTAIEAARQQADPNSLLNRPPRVFVAEVKDAPGDGDESLTRQLRSQMASNGAVVAKAQAGADYAVQGLVHMAAGKGGTDRVEIQWVVLDARGNEAGRVVQLNEVPPGSLGQYWGDVALVVTQQAAGGIRNVITNQQVKPKAKTLEGEHPAG